MTQLFQPTAQLKISITPDCNNDCQICLNKTTRSRNGQKNKLSKYKIKELIDEASRLGFLGTYWTGGEPLLKYENLIELIKYSTEKGLLSTIVTNGGFLAATSNYKIMNKELLEKAGLYNLNTQEIVKSLKEAGLTRVYFSVDNNHTSLESANSKVYTSVPTEVVAKGIRAFLDNGFGTIHTLEAIGYQLRLTATSSGLWDKPTNNIIQDVLNKIGAKFEKEISPVASIYENQNGKLIIKRIAISNIGDAEDLNNKVLENKVGENLFNIKCTHFIPKSKANDNGKFHRDLFIDNNGIVYTCGNHAYPVGNVFKESLTTIIKGINNPDLDSEYGINRSVFYSILLLSENERIGNNAIGEAMRLIHTIDPKFIKNLRTQCGGCNSLGNNKELQNAFLKAFGTNSL